MRILHSSTGVLAFLTAVMLGPAAGPECAGSQPHQRNVGRQKENLIREVRHELLMLPYYSVFDNQAFKVDGDHVTLMGQVMRPTLKSDAESAVKRVEGVASVTNNIEVLPLSPNDDRIRRCGVPRHLRHASVGPLRSGVSSCNSHHREERAGHAGGYSG